MKKKRKVWRWVLIAVLVIAAIVAFVLIRQSQNSASRYTEETVRSGSIETYYSFSGNIAVRDSQSAAAKVNATVRDIYVQEEQMVAADTPLMRLSNGDIIKADIAGEVTDIHVSAGDSVSVGTALIDIVDFDNLQVLMNVDEYDVGAVTVGKEAEVTIEALGMTYEGTVEHISKQAQSFTEKATSYDPTSSITYYQAKVSAPVDERILPGMKVDVKILSEQKDEATLLSMNALQFDAYNKPFVYVKNSAGEVTKMQVGVGIQDGTTVEITEGLRAGDVVQIPQSTSLFPMFDRAR